MCSPVLSMPKQGQMFGMAADTMAWHGQADGSFFVQQPMQSYAATLPGVPASPMHLGAQSSGAAWDWSTGAAPSGPPILSTSPKKSGRRVEAAVLPHLAPGEPYFTWMPAASQASPAGDLCLLGLEKQGDPQIETNEEAVDVYKGSDSPVRIRNTFLDSPLERSPSLERFFEERKVRSCPVSGPHSRQISGRSTPRPVGSQDHLSINTPSASALVTPRDHAGSSSSLRAGIAPGGSAVKPCNLALIAAAGLAEAALGYAAVESSSTSSTSAGNVPCSGPVSETSGSGAISLSQHPTADRKSVV